MANSGTGTRIGIGGNIVNRTVAASRIRLKEGLGLVGAAAAAGTAPYGLAAARVIAVKDQSSAANRSHIRRSSGVLYAVTAVACRESDRRPVCKVTVVTSLSRGFATTP